MGSDRPFTRSTVIVTGSSFGRGTSRCGLFNSAGCWLFNSTAPARSMWFAPPIRSKQLEEPRIGPLMLCSDTDPPFLVLCASHGIVASPLKGANDPKHACDEASRMQHYVSSSLVRLYYTYSIHPMLSSSAYKCLFKHLGRRIAAIQFARHRRHPWLGIQ